MVMTEQYRPKNWGLYPSWPVGGGKTFFVNGNDGDDGNTGVDPAYPLKTITRALELCQDGRNDYIISMIHYQETFPIAVNKSTVHIIGLGNLQAMFCRMTASGDTAIFEVGDKDFYEIAGFSMDAGAGHGCIEVGAGESAARGCIHDCWFGVLGGSQDGIYIPDGAGLPSCMIFNNVFGATITRDGFRGAGSCYRSAIYNNWFNVINAGTNRGVHIVKEGAQLWLIKDNDFHIYVDDQAGKAIQIESNATVFMIVGNRAGQGAVAMTNNPYRDLYSGAADTSNTWVMNYEGNTVMYPDFT